MTRAVVTRRLPFTAASPQRLPVEARNQTSAAAPGCTTDGGTTVSTCVAARAGAATSNAVTTRLSTPIASRRAFLIASLQAILATNSVRPSDEAARPYRTA